LVLAASLLSVSSASGLTVGVLTSSPGLDQGFATCISSCGSNGTLVGPAPISSGSSITFANGLALSTETVSISLTQLLSNYTNGISKNWSYAATVQATVTSLGGGLLLLQQSGFATGSVPEAPASPDVNSLTCIVTAAGLGSCGFTFGPNSYDVAMGPTFRFQETFNLVLPEPGTLALMVTGIAGLALAGRRRQAR
jgi:hypothetical protein